MNILIVGKNSFVGRGVGEWFQTNHPAVSLDYISVRDDTWKTTDLSAYDVIIFTAAIVHRPNIKDFDTYEKINVRLPLDFANHAKLCGVKQFIFMSSVSVYGSDRTLPKGTLIDITDVPAPTTMYGKSKLIAENGLWKLSDDRFHISIIRSTYVYGKGCRGNRMSVLKKLADKLPFIPKAFDDVSLGMIYIDNLAELCYLIAASDMSGIYHAQDQSILSTTRILQLISPQKKQLSCQWMIRLICRLSVVKRLFGGLAYTDALTECPLGEYRSVSMADGIRHTLDL